MEQRKRNISVRLSTSDIRKIKDISARLGVKESELFRFAVKNMLTKLMPLNDDDLKGADLIPTWLECGDDLLAYFDIDADQLDEIINNNAQQEETRVEFSDLDLMVLSSLNRNYVVKKLSDVCGMQVDPANVKDILRAYLHDKYVLGQNCDCSEMENESNTLESAAAVSDRMLTDALAY